MGNGTRAAPGTGGPARLLLMSDTHLPRRARRLPDELLQAVGQADLVVHAGDWIDEATLDLLEHRARRLVGVYGNNDGPELRARLPEVAGFSEGGLRFGVVHETGTARGREERCAAQYPDVDVLVFGHSHIPWDTEAPGGLRLLHPGSPTDRRRQPHCTSASAQLSSLATYNARSIRPDTKGALTTISASSPGGPSGTTPQNVDRDAVALVISE